ncbi:MAG: hypothetical protein FJY91_03075 [Candidatus Harrisonbacteria bacterium]|nr:hypothetical protein [Candidatus Harrisonbacteria bacterium]
MSQVFPWKEKIKNIPSEPGCYLMKNSEGVIIYVGKAVNLNRRVTSYFTRPHDARIENLVKEIHRIDIERTNSALEALVLEAALIKKHAPKYNILEKDDKSFLFVEITREHFPRLRLVRGKDRIPRGEYYGPFVQGGAIREALVLLRRILPVCDLMGDSLELPKRPCFNYGVGLCPGPCAAAISEREYKKIIRGYRLIFSGKTKSLIRNLKKEMATAAKNLDFERAESFRKKIFALEHVNDVSLIKEDDLVGDAKQTGIRIEGYDISNISGTNAVGVMVVFENGIVNRDEHRTFGIKSVIGSNDVAMMRETLDRRLRHSEWRFPDLILIDGGAAQVGIALEAVRAAGLKIPVLGLAKGPDRKKNDLIGGDIPAFSTLETLIRVRDEAHRFAISTYRRKHRRTLLSE